MLNDITTLGRCECFNGIEVKVFIDVKSSKLKIQFNNGFYVHPEVVKTVDYYIQKASEDKRLVGDSLVNHTAIWMNNYLTLAFNKKLASMYYTPGFIKIARSY